MSHHHHQPLNKKKPVTSNRLPKNAYGALVGKLDGPLSNADNNHVFIFVRISNGPHKGRYKLAFNTESTDHSAVQFFVHDEEIAMAAVPAEEFTTDASLSYVDLGLHQTDFQEVANGQLRTIVQSSAHDADLVAAYGVTFSDGTGIHDLHYNNGEKPGSKFGNHPNKDGALVFYYFNRSGHTSRRWIFIKFHTQSLP